MAPAEITGFLTAANPKSEMVTPIYKRCKFFSYKFTKTKKEKNQRAHVIYIFPPLIEIQFSSQKDQKVIFPNIELEHRFQELNSWEKERKGGGKCGDLGVDIIGEEEVK
jgi:hypothetical protein